MGFKTFNPRIGFIFRFFVTRSSTVTIVLVKRTAGRKNLSTESDLISDCLPQILFYWGN